MERALADLVTFEVIPLVRTALKETAELTGALQVLAERAEQLTAELADGELEDLRTLFAQALRALETAQGGGRSWTTRDRTANLRLFRLFSEILRAIEAGVFHPVVGWRCEDCPYRSRCWALAAAGLMSWE